MKHVLVTGGAGYLGSHLVRKLLEKGYFVTVLDNFTYGDGGMTGISSHRNIRVLEGDICNVKDVVKATIGNTAIVALAAIVGDPACALSEEETLSTNYESTKVLVEIAKYYKVRRILFASSCSVYGENSELILNEGSWLNPVSLYARTRIMSEEVLLKNCENVVPVILRMGTLFGQSYRMRYDLVINTLTAKAVRENRIQIFGGDQWRPFVPVQDAAEAYINALEADDSLVSKQIFNIGSDGSNLKIGDLAPYIRKVVPDVRLDIRNELADKRSYRVSFSKVEKLLGFKAKIGVADGIREMAEFLKAEPDINYLDDIYYNVKYLFKNLI
jgi:nucleoside-diphosphate-sugar epimerase